MNPARGETAVEIGGKKHVVRLNLQQIAEIEDAVGPVVAFVTSAQSGRVKASHVFAIIKIALGDKLTEADILAAGVNGLINPAMEILVPIFEGNIQNAGEKATGEA